MLKTAEAPASIGVGDETLIDGVLYKCFAVEELTTTKVADVNSDQYATQLKRRALNLYTGGVPRIEKFQRGDVITEKTLCARFRAKSTVWNAYSLWIVKKGDVDL